MPFATNLRRNVLKVFVTVSLVLIAYLGLGLYQAWKDHVRETKEHLERDAATVSNVIESALIDASKVLDVAQRRLEREMQNGRLPPEKAHEILARTVDEFSLHKTTDFLGLLGVHDANGNLYALNNGIVNQSLNYSDYHFFSELKSKPYLQLAVGNLFVSKVNGKKVFHLAKPLKDRSGSFAGAVALQIFESDLSKALDGIMGKDGDITYVYASNEQITYVYRESKQPNTESYIDGERLINIINAHSTLTGSFKVSGREIHQPYDMYAESPRESWRLIG